MNYSRIYALALNPMVVIGSLLLGLLTGAAAPAFSSHLDFIGDAYVGLMKMIILPFMVSAVILSLQRLLREGGAGPLLVKVALVFFGSAITAVSIGAAVSLPVQA